MGQQWSLEGQEFPLFKERWEKQKGNSFCAFDTLDENTGYILTVYLDHMTEKEKEILKDKPMNVRLVETAQGFVLPLIRFGNSPLIFELGYDPTIYPDARSLQFTTHNNLLGIAAIESTNNVLKVARTANMPLRMIQKCADIWAKAILEVDYSEKYAKWLLELRSRYTVIQLWERGIPVGKLGEVYDLKEINYHS